MKKILLIAGIVFGTFVVAVLVACLTLASEFALDRSIRIQASPEEVHAYVGHLDRWPEGTPWEQMDDTMVVKPGASTTGIGASQSWEGKDGQGELVFTKCDPASGIAYDMKFINGEIEAPSACAMTYTRDGEATVVHWTMEGDAADMMPALMAGPMRVLMEVAISEAFDTGLAELKTKVEGAKG